MAENTRIPKPYQVLLTAGEAEIVEKKSRFIAYLAKCESEEEATDFIEKIKKKHWDARHNCSAFVIGDSAQLTRCSDDGEPAGTAGRPMLEVLLGSGVRNVAVVVTRYFGGVLLGTGGLVRAYSQAVKEALAASKIGTMQYGYRLSITTDYNGIGKVLYQLGQRGIEPYNSDYGADVTLELLVPYDEKERLCKEITEATLGKAVIEKIGEEFFCV